MFDIASFDIVKFDIIKLDIKKLEITNCIVYSKICRLFYDG